MNARAKIAIAAGVAGLLGLGGLAGMAQADRKHGRHGMHGHHGMGMHRMIKDFAERYDTNKDGKVTQDEVDANRSQWHGEFDGDKDSALTLQEFQNLWLKARHDRMVREFQRFDRDGDGKVTLDEYQRPLVDVVERWDRNSDGALSKEDRQRRHERRGDRDGDDERRSDDNPQSE